MSSDDGLSMREVMRILEDGDVPELGLEPSDDEHRHENWRARQSIIYRYLLRRKARLGRRPRVGRR